jgi:hypothetical protein
VRTFGTPSVSHTIQAFAFVGLVGGDNAAVDTDSLYLPVYIA